MTTPAPLPVKFKDPNAVLPYQIDWSDWLNGDTISTSTWTVPSGITKNSATFTGTAATIILAGGTAGQTYALTNEITTAGGLIEDRTVTVVAVNR